MGTDTPEIEYCVDGLDASDCYAGDGETAPFVIFCIPKQENLPGFYKTRADAEWSLKLIVGLK